MANFHLLSIMISIIKNLYKILFSRSKANFLTLIVINHTKNDTKLDNYWFAVIFLQGQ